MKEALFWERGKNSIKCELCPRSCLIPEGRTGFCSVRKNTQNKLYSLNYGRLVSINPDPIEKKPLFHFAPGTQCLSIATVGCNLGCKYCQNWEISQPKRIIGEKYTPEKVVEIAKKNGLPGIAYTYVEPTIFFEFALDVMKLAKKNGLYNVWVTNGYTSKETIDTMTPYLDAVNVDYKGDINFYSKLCQVPNPETIKGALLLYKKNKIWIEITNLLIPGWNDKPEQIKEMCQWIVSNLGSNTPLHISRFFPNYKLNDIPPTPENIMKNAYDIAKKTGLEYVYLGNMPGNDRESTFCPKCNFVVIERDGYSIGKVNKRCPKCGFKIHLSGMF